MCLSLTSLCHSSISNFDMQCSKWVALWLNAYDTVTQLNRAATGQRSGEMFKNNSHAIGRKETKTPAQKQWHRSLRPCRLPLSWPSTFDNVRFCICACEAWDQGSPNFSSTRATLKKQNMSQATHLFYSLWIGTLFTSPIPCSSSPCPGCAIYVFSVYIPGK